jgi:hypothetical protein
VFVAVLAFGDIQTVGVFGAYYLFCLAFNIIYSVSALAISVRYNRYPRHILRKVWLAIVLDILFYRYFNLVMYLGGTLMYFWKRNNKNDWNKVSRIKREYCAPAV